MFFIEVQATVRSERRVYVGEGFWPLPEEGKAYEPLIGAMTQAIWRGVMELLKGHSFRLEISAQSLELKGAVAEKVQSGCEKWPADSREQMTWQERGPRYGR